MGEPAVPPRALSSQKRDRDSESLPRFEPAIPRRCLVGAGVAAPASRPQDEPERDQHQTDRQGHPEREPGERQLRGSHLRSRLHLHRCCGCSLRCLRLRRLRRLRRGGLIDLYCACAADDFTIRSCFTAGLFGAEEAAMPMPPNDATATTIRPERARLSPNAGSAAFADHALRRRAPSCRRRSASAGSPEALSRCRTRRASCVLSLVELPVVQRDTAGSRQTLTASSARSTGQAP